MKSHLQFGYLGNTTFFVALKSLAILANSKELVTSITLTEKLGIESSFIRKVLAKLMQSQIVEGYGGRYGGYRLLTKPEETTLYDIYIGLINDTNNNAEPSKLDKTDKLVLSILLESQKETEKILKKYTLSYISQYM